MSKQQKIKNKFISRGVWQFIATGRGSYNTTVYTVIVIWLVSKANLTITPYAQRDYRK